MEWMLECLPLRLLYEDYNVLLLSWNGPFYLFISRSIWIFFRPPSSWLIKTVSKIKNPLSSMELFLKQNGDPYQEQDLSLSSLYHLPLILRSFLISWYLFLKKDRYSEYLFVSSLPIEEIFSYSKENQKQNGGATRSCKRSDEHFKKGFRVESTFLFFSSSL